jgi:hypothetical protein
MIATDASHAVRTTYEGYDATHRHQTSRRTLAAVRYRIESAGQPEAFVHVQDKPLEVGDTFFHPPGESRVGLGFYKVTAVEPGVAGLDALIKADRLPASGL